MKIGKNEEEGKEEPIKNLAIIKTQEQDGYIDVKIVQQDSKSVGLGTLWTGCIDGNKIMIASARSVEFRSAWGDTVFYLRGTGDYNAKEHREIHIPKDQWKIVKQALENAGALVDKEPEPETEEPEDGIDYDTTKLEPTPDEIEKMISLVDIDTFNKIIKNRLFDELDDKEKLADVSRDWAKEYLKEWAKSKYKFFKILGDKLSIEKEVEINLTPNEYETKINEIKEKFPLYRPIFSRISTDAFMKRQMTTSNSGCEFFNDKNVKSGMSITKFFSLYNNHELDTEISKIYQDKNKATIHISINPIDFLTVSINKSGWKSCHHFLSGCYKNAGLSYMFDKVSLVAYKSNVDVNYNYHFPYDWNTKSWRQMIYMDEKSSAMVFSRQYPCDSPDTTKFIREMLEEKVSAYFNSENMWKVFSHETKANLIVEKDAYYLGYNDVSSGFDHVVVKAKDDKKYKKESTIKIGGKVKFLFNKRKIVRNVEGWIARND